MDKLGDYFMNERREMLEFIPENTATMLEIGCGGGNFGKVVKGKYENVYIIGMEIDEKAAKKASEILDKVYVGDTFDQLEKIGDGSIDCIVLNDVIEHVMDVDGLLNALKNKLSEDGVITASIPNFLHISVIRDVFVRKDFKYTDDGILDKTHQRFFTKKSIIRLFEKNGFEIKKIRGINSSKRILVKFLSILSMGYYDELRYLQFAVVAALKKTD